MKRIVAVIPAYDEASRVVSVVSEAVQYADAVVVVDDGSHDGTGRAVMEAVPSAHVVRHAVNLGKGAALKTGYEAARRLGAEIIVTLDADGQHPPHLIPKIVRHLEAGGYGIVFGSRVGGDRMPFVRLAGNRAVNAAARYGFGLDLADIWCGFRAFRADLLPRMPFSARDYSGEVQMALSAASVGIPYGEFPIPTVYADTAKGVHIMHGVSLLGRMALWWAMRYNSIR